LGPCIAFISRSVSTEIDVKALPHHDGSTERAKQTPEKKANDISEGVHCFVFAALVGSEQTVGMRWLEPTR
jgi:hypothetical protein